MEHSNANEQSTTEQSAARVQQEHSKSTADALSKEQDGAACVAGAHTGVLRSAYIHVLL